MSRPNRVVAAESLIASRYSQRQLYDTHGCVIDHTELPVHDESTSNSVCRRHCRAQHDPASIRDYITDFWCPQQRTQTPNHYTTVKLREGKTKNATPNKCSFHLPSTLIPQPLKGATVRIGRILFWTIKCV